METTVDSQPMCESKGEVENQKHCCTYSRISEVKRTRSTIPVDIEYQAAWNMRNMLVAGIVGKVLGWAARQARRQADVAVSNRAFSSETPNNAGAVSCLQSTL